MAPNLFSHNCSIKEEQILYILALYHITSDLLFHFPPIQIKESDLLLHLFFHSNKEKWMDKNFSHQFFSLQHALKVVISSYKYLNILFFGVRQCHITDYLFVSLKYLKIKYFKMRPFSSVL